MLMFLIETKSKPYSSVNYDSFLNVNLLQPSGHNEEFIPTAELLKCFPLQYKEKPLGGLNPHVV